MLLSVLKSGWAPCEGNKQISLLIFGISGSTFKDTDASSKIGFSGFFNEETPEGQKNFIKEQVISMVTFILPIEDQSPRQLSCTCLCGSSEKMV